MATNHEARSRPPAEPDRVDDLVAEYDEERPARSLSRPLDLVVGAYCFSVALLVIWQVLRPFDQGNQYYLVVFLGLTLPLVFVCYRPRGRRGSDGHDNPGMLDWLLAATALVVGLYPVTPLTSVGGGDGGFTGFLDRQGQLAGIDVLMGALLLLLVIEATRRSSGLILPVVGLVFLAYSYYGGYLPLGWEISHAGQNFDQIINSLYNESSGFFGVPMDVAGTYIVLFTIYGCVLDKLGAGRFFIEFSFSLFRHSRTAPGRTVATSGFLLGTVSGSGTATTVTLGSIAWPILKRAGYPANAAGGMLAASGIGAILSPPTLGAAAFIIAEYLGVSYASVLLWAVVPTLLYYLGIFLAVEIDARRFGAARVELAAKNPLALLVRSGYHFVSLGIIVVFLAMDVPPLRAVVYATAVACLFGLAEALLSRRPAPSGLDEADADVPGEPMAVPVSLAYFARRLASALAAGVRSALPVIAVCAAAGIITSVIAKTGLGQVLADVLVDAANALSWSTASTIAFTAVFAAVAILVLGLAVPVTASFILSWVIIGPALITIGVEPAETAMFIFYYAVLSEVSPPTALAAVAASAITGGKVIPTMWQACKYTLPAFLVPLAFVLTPNGTHLLWQGPFVDIVWTTLVSGLAVGALAVATTGWMFGPTRRLERTLCVPAAVCLLYLERSAILIGLSLLVGALLVHLIGRRARPEPERVS